MLALDRGSGALWSDGRRFDPGSRSWGGLSGKVTGERVSPVAAVAWLQRETQFRVKLPIGVIGPREASAGQCAVAEAIGGGLADMRLTVICGGWQGISGDEKVRELGRVSFLRCTASVTHCSPISSAPTYSDRLSVPQFSRC